ncbi:hypothetical protein GGX14DRAFT_407840 [Mycena pura]|uniref:Uncharacterized protein n=1 Tax=Mycena pura TaxID=153505 RepID=A0AAD6UP40_9AGAR|nr:hypothetical protein GGX14DRAFT_407840 [Mycena pura]
MSQRTQCGGVVVSTGDAGNRLRLALKLDYQIPPGRSGQVENRQFPLQSHTPRERVRGYTLADGEERCESRDEGQLIYVAVGEATCLWGLSGSAGSHVDVNRYLACRGAVPYELETTDRPAQAQIPRRRCYGGFGANLECMLITHSPAPTDLHRVVRKCEPRVILSLDGQMNHGLIRVVGRRRLTPSSTREPDWYIEITPERESRTSAA